MHLTEPELLLKVYPPIQTHPSPTFRNHLKLAHIVKPSGYHTLNVEIAGKKMNLIKPST